VSREEINEAIAQLLGFVKHPHTNGEQWVYPEKYEYMRAGTPEFYTPDFIEIIERYHQMAEITKYGYPREYGGTFSRSKTETFGKYIK
jgi:hypothetical protein